MSGDLESITISKCPICSDKHIFNLKVKRSVIYYFRTGDFKERQKRRSFTRLFTCPKKLEDFQGRISLYETSDSPIESVDVIGASDE